MVQGLSFLEARAQVGEGYGELGAIGVLYGRRREKR
jgi:hypothetical protein